MAILEGDIKLLKSQVMNDVAEGGGRATGVEIVDGASNSIFNDISDLDRAYGRVNMRKVFVNVDTLNTDGYFGAHVVVANPPVDPKVSCTLLTTQDSFDTRGDASGRVESYLAQGTMYAGILFGDHIAGQQTISVLQHTRDPLPTIGDTFLLRKNEGASNAVEQYVRVVDVVSRVRIFSDSAGEFERNEIILTLGDPLKNDFPGLEVSRTTVTINFIGKTKIYTTIVADAARYYGATPLATAALTGDLVVKGASIFTQIVPSTRIEIPLNDSRMNQKSAVLSKAGDEINLSISLAFGTTQSMYIGGGILPSSLVISRGGVTITDKGGTLMSSGNQVGTVDYENGVCALSVNVFGTSSGVHDVRYTPASSITIVNSSIGIPVTKQNQRLNWIATIDPSPTRRTLQVSYRALGRWYVMTEDGTGAIRGSDSSFGAGTLNFQTGSVSLTLGALPDAGSQIILTYAAGTIVRPISVVPKSNFTDLDSFACVVDLGRPLAADCTFTWNDGVARTAVVANRSITGDAKGECDIDTGIVRFSPTILPAKNTVITVTSSVATNAKTTINFVTANGFHTATVGATMPNSFRAAVCVLVEEKLFTKDTVRMHWAKIYDDGVGHLRFASPNAASYQIGTINYVTGVISVGTDCVYTTEEPNFVYKTHFADASPGSLVSIVGAYEQDGYKSVVRAATILDNTVGAPAPPTWAWGWLLDGSSAYVSRNIDESGATPLSFNFTEIFYPRQPDSVKLGAVRFVWDGISNEYKNNLDPATGLGTTAGYKVTLAGQSGMLLTTWNAGSNSSPTSVIGVPNLDASGVSGLMVTESVTFRTAISPLFNGGFTISGTWIDGAIFTVTSDADGLIKTATSTVRGVVGKVNYDTGVATLRFGKLGGVLGDGSTQDLSYLNIAGVTLMTAEAVRADSLRYSAVGYSYIPLDSTILGLNTVRLPSDGRVPIFRKGGVALVHHTKKSNPTTVSNGQTINLSRGRLARIRVVGNDKVTINNGYTVDLDAGTVTFIDVTGYSQPVKIEDRIEDLALIKDAQIDGTLSLTRQLTHNFPLGSYISSALIIGDMSARVPILFDQATWTGNLWGDTVNGSPATPSFNDVLAPIEVTNSGAITERWVVRFTNTNSFEIIGEHVGVVATGNTSTNCAPINPASSTPYFTIRAIGWGNGWAVGNIVRFNTVGALFPMWIIRTIQQGPATAQDDSFTLLTLGDIDRL